MTKLPKRRTLRGVVQDAISDRQSFDDETITDTTTRQISEYQALLPRLSDRAPPLTDRDKQLIGRSCIHARYWRESFLDANLHTGDRSVIHAARLEVDQITRIETALGIKRPDPFAGCISVTLAEIRASIGAP